MTLEFNGLYDVRIEYKSGKIHLHKAVFITKTAKGFKFRNEDSSINFELKPHSWKQVEYTSNVG